MLPTAESLGLKFVNIETLQIQDRLQEMDGKVIRTVYFSENTALTITFYDGVFIRLTPGETNYDHEPIIANRDDADWSEFSGLLTKSQVEQFNAEKWRIHEENRRQQSLREYRHHKLKERAGTATSEERESFRYPYWINLAADPQAVEIAKVVASLTDEQAKALA